MKNYITLALALTIGTLGFSHSASADQKSKNTWRNATIGSSVITGYGLLHHNKTVTILGAAGTAYSASRYEKDRHNQSQENSGWRNGRKYSDIFRTEQMYRESLRERQMRKEHLHPYEHNWNNNDNQNRDYHNRNNNR